MRLLVVLALMTSLVHADRLVFEADLDRSEGDLYSISEDGTRLTRLTAALPPYVGAGEVSPDGSLIAFAHNNSIIDALDVWLLDIGGGTPERVTELGWATKPTWSPDGRRLAFVTYTDVVDSECGGSGYPLGCLDVFVLDLASGDMTNISRSPDREYWPAWSPAGEYIAATRVTETNDSDLWIMREDGSELQRLTGSGDVRGKPSWTPDGDCLVVEVHTEDWVRLAIMAATGGRRTYLPTGGDWSHEPSVSRDGTKVAFTRWEPGSGPVTDIWILHRASNVLTRVTNRAAEYRGISWVSGPSVSVVRPAGWGHLKHGH